jgi:AcrR family transcriptional regulator
VSSQVKLTKKQQDILSAATILFAEKGFAATSTNEIAKKAGVAEGTIFRHYRTKKDLLLSLVSPMMVQLIAPVVKKDIFQVLEQDFAFFEDFVRAMIQNRMLFVQKNLPLIRILFQELPFQAELKEQFMTHIGNEVFNKMKAMIVHYQAKGQIIDLPPASIIRTIAGSVISYILLRHVVLPEQNWDDRAEVERMIHMIKHGISPVK